MFEIPTGVVADVVSRRLSIILGFGLIGCGFALESWFPTFGVVLAAQVVWGIGFTFTSGAVQAWIVDEVGRPEGALFLRRAQLGNLGALLGIACAVGLGSIALWLPLFVAGCGMGALSLVLLAVMPETGFRPLPREQRGSFAAMLHTLGEGGRAVRRRPELGFVLAAAFLIGVSSEPLDRLWELHFLDQVGLPLIGAVTPVVWFGVLNAASLLLTIGAAGWMRRHVQIDDEAVAIRVLRLVNGLLVVAVCGFALAGSFALAVAAFLGMGVLRRVAGPVESTWLNQRIPSEVRATVLSASTQCDSFGQFLGGPALGALARGFGLQTAFLTTAALLLPLQGLYARAGRRQQPARTEAPPS